MPKTSLLTPEILAAVWYANDPKRAANRSREMFDTDVPGWAQWKPTKAEQAQMDAGRRAMPLLREECRIPVGEDMEIRVTGTYHGSTVIT